MVLSRGTEDAVTTQPSPPVELDVRVPVWDRIFTVAPLVLVGTREPDGAFDLAPKHLVVPLGWQNHFGFVCTPRHATWVNALRERVFTVSYPRPEQFVQASLTASARCEDGTKPASQALPTVPARRVVGVLVDGAVLQLECELERVVEGFGDNGLVVGRIVAAYADPAALLDADREPEEVLGAAPLLAYVHPGRFASISAAFSFPVPEDMHK
jgi:flavin reductase (DIM6/NTAB) family NADH-FMN oxidoreductase RutF